MPSKRVIQAGHILAMVFIALLLAGARGFLGAHPVLSGALLMLVAPVYYVAARVSGHRQFLHPACLLAVLGYQLIVYGGGVGLEHQPLIAVLPIALFLLAATREMPKSVPDGHLSLYGAINFIIAAFSIWTLLRVPTQFTAAALTTALALAGYAGYAWLRFVRTEKVAYALATVSLGSGAFIFLLYSRPAVALGVGAAAGLAVMADLRVRKMLPRLETAAFAVVGAYLIFIAVTGSRATQVPLGYLVLAGTWLHLGLVLHRPELPPLAGPHPAPLPRLLPLFAAGILLPLVPIALFYPWPHRTLVAPFLTVFFVLFLATARELGKQSFSLIGVVLARALAAMARVAPAAVLVYLAWHGFSPSYRVGLASLTLAALSLLAAYRQTPHLLRRRNLYAYQAAVFVSIAYFLAERRLALGGVAGTLLDSGAPLIFVLAAVALALRPRVAPGLVITLYEAACLPAAIACVLQVLRGQLALSSALLLGTVLIAACAVVFAKVRRPATVFTLPIVLGLWIYVGEWTAGVRGELLGLPYLIFGILSAALGYWLVRRGNRWHELFYFMWFLCTGVSLVLFAPMRDAGAYAAPLWAVVFLLIARATASRRDPAIAVVLEVLSASIAVGTVLVLIAHASYVEAAAALVIYAVVYTWLALARDAEAYLYPAAIAVVGGYFLGVLATGRALLFLAYFLPLAAVMYLLAAESRRRGLVRLARPLNLAATAGAVAGALLFLALPFASHTVLGFSVGIAYCALYAALTAYNSERGFLSGVGLAGAFFFYEFLVIVPAVTRGNRLAFFVPVALVLILIGRRQHRTQDTRGAWSLYAAAIVVTALASVFAMWPQPADPRASRVVLLVAIAVWPVLLVWTANEIFIYAGTLGIALLAYHFVQNSADMFGQHLVAFFLFGTVLLGLVFLAATARKFMRFRRPTLLVPPAHWYDRVVYLVPVAVLAVATFGSWGVSSSSNPHFCGACHNMGQYFANWKTSAHARADVSCARCHYEPGIGGFIRAKVKGTRQLVSTLTETAANRPEARVSNETCMAAGCHSRDQLAQPVMMRTVRFRHASHLGTMARGPELRCTSCHTSVDPAKHFAVDTNTCFTCHFHADRTASATAVTACVGCHELRQEKVHFDHAAAGVTADNAACAGCHQAVLAGTGAVEPRQCRHCHIERAAQLMAAAAADVHGQHVRGRGVGCDWCHAPVAHGRLDRAAATD